MSIPRPTSARPSSSRPSSAGRPSSASSNHQVLPPIITNEKDRQFLATVTSHINDELDRIDPHNGEQVFVVYKGAFDMVINYVTSYKPLLTMIKAEYEDIVESIQQGERDAFYLSGKLKAMSTEPCTLRNYRRRADELEQKMSIIQTDNERLKKQLSELRAARESRQMKTNSVQDAPKKVVRTDRRRVPGLTLEQSTDLRTLKRELEKLEKQLRELSLTHRTRYLPKNITDQLKDQLAAKVTLRDELLEQTDILKMKRKKLKVALEAAESYMDIQPLHQTIGDAVVAALTAWARRELDKTEHGTTEDSMSHQTSNDDDDPNKENEAETMLEYIEKFTELIEDQYIEEAALHAANSPKGILRTQEILHRFKGLNTKTDRGRNAVLAFADALMSTVDAYGVKPDEYISQECVKAALKENKLDFVSHWMAQDRLTLSEELGSMLQEYAQMKPAGSQQCLTLVQKIYTDLHLHLPAVKCMLEQRRVRQGLEYAVQVHLPQDDCLELLGLYPCASVLEGMYELALIPIGVIVLYFEDTELFDMGMNLLHRISKHKYSDGQGDWNTLHHAVFADTETTENEWTRIVDRCRTIGYHSVALEISASILVQGATAKAVQVVNRQHIVRTVRGNITPPIHPTPKPSENN